MRGDVQKFMFSENLPLSSLKNTFFRQGNGNPLILIDVAFCHISFGANVRLPQYLTDHYMVYTYDPRVRGESDKNSLVGHFLKN